MDKLKQTIIVKRFPIISLQKKDAADLGISSMLLTLALLLLAYGLILFLVQCEEIRVVRNTIQRGLMLTSLSAGISDDEYISDLELEQIRYNEENGMFEICDEENTMSGIMVPEDTYQNYLDLLQVNVTKCMEGLRDEAGNARFTNWQLKTFILYNVAGSKISVYECKDGVLGCSRIVDRTEAEIVTPAGNPINDSSIYGEITFTYRDLLGVEHSNLSIRQYSAIRMREGE